MPPSPVLAPESALGSRPRVALSSAQVFSVYLAGLWLGNFPLLGLGSPPGVGRRQLLSRAAQMASARPASFSAGVT